MSGGVGFARICVANALPYILECKSVGKSMSFLECQLSATYGHISTMQHLKDSALICTLHPSSSHPTGVHLGWPNAIPHRVAGLGNSRTNFLKSMAAIEERLASNLAHPYIRKIAGEAQLPGQQCAKVVAPQRDAGSKLWCVLPFHAIFHKFHVVLDGMNDGYMNALLATAFKKACTLKLAWSLNSSNSVFTNIRNAYQTE